MQDRIKQMAVEAGFRIEDGGWLLCGPPSKPEPEIDALERFAQAVARECADGLVREAKTWVDHAAIEAIDDADRYMSLVRADSLNNEAADIRARFGIEGE